MVVTHYENQAVDFTNILSLYSTENLFLKFSVPVN